ncbi:flagellar hook-basal body protein [Sulfobacillus harzensis]|uniref:Flagellar hook basal-body protein n=1 Tax=Sulfobacillus harzensis TaxID=2729629 RepID=A0A7Y0Q2D2_9FIRM|nr:flagellar hook basal-body protein [Sulfobacillus harzensis]NMP23073.1 flagellar hook basal-body protein [Sulfobacillus harzensis]
MDALYIAAAGMIGQNQNLALVAGNLSNSQSPGYLAESGTFEAFPSGTVVENGRNPKVLGQSSSGVAFTSAIDMAGSGVESTGNPNNVAILGNGFFVVRTANGIAYTRDGQFSVDALGRLVTARGDLVLGKNGQPIHVKTGQGFTVSPTGVITQGTTTVGALALTNLSPVGLKALGNDLYTSPTRLPFTGQVLQSAVNSSNVNVADEMVQMIDAQSRYQSLTEMVNEESKRLSTAATLGVLA